MPDTFITGIWIGMSAIVGLLIGSFLNVCIYRLPAGLTIVHGHSFCPKCHHDLGAFDLVPVFSYLLLGRRCRYCGEPIAPRYMRVELTTGLYFALAALIVRPGAFSLPAWMGGLEKLAGAAADFEASLFMLLAVTLAFCGLLIWAMIIWDEQRVPKGVFIFTLFPVALRLAMQPGLLLYHAAGMLLSLLVVLVMVLFGLLPETDRQKQLVFGGGLCLLGLMAGLKAIQPVLLVLLVELLLMALRGRRLDSSAEKQASLLWRSIPLQALVIGSVLWLVY